MPLFARWYKDESGQDLTEYTLLLSFVALVAAALYVQSTDAIKGIWLTTDNWLKNASDGHSM